jgi:hypothetical protein
MDESSKNSTRIHATGEFCALAATGKPFYVGAAGVGMGGCTKAAGLYELRTI